MQFNLDTDTYLLIGYPSIAKPLNLRYGTYRRLSAAATIWERIQKPAAIYLISKECPTVPKMLVSREDFNACIDLNVGTNRNLVNVDVCSIRSSTEPKLALNNRNEVVTSSYVLIQGVPTHSHYFNRFNESGVNVDQAIYDGLREYTDDAHRRIEVYKAEDIYPTSLRQRISVLVEVAIEDRLSLYQGER